MTLKYGFSLKCLLFISSADKRIDQNMDLFLQDKILRWKKSILRFSNRIAECRMTSKQSIHRLARVRSIGMTCIRISDPKSLTDHEASNKPANPLWEKIQLFILNDPSDLKAVILIRIIPKEGTTTRWKSPRTFVLIIRPIKHQPNQISLHSNPALRTPHY